MYDLHIALIFAVLSDWPFAILGFFIGYYILGPLFFNN
jgi:hypothetical protein